jgi:hypothetical protein
MGGGKAGMTSWYLVYQLIFIPGTADYGAVIPTFV